MKKCIKKFTFLLALIFSLTACAKRDEDKIVVINEETKTDDESLMAWNNKVINFKIDGEDENEGIVIEAKVEVYADNMYTGKILKEMPSKEKIENNCFDNMKTIDVTEKYKNHDISQIDDNEAHYALYDSNENLLQIYHGNSSFGEYEDKEFEHYEVDFYSVKATYLDASEDEGILQCEKILNELGLNVKKSKYYEIKYNEKIYRHIDFFNILDDIPVITPKMGADNTFIETVDSKICKICFTPKYEFDGEKTKVDKILSPDQIIEFLKADYENGHITIPPHEKIDKIELVYLETKDNSVIPAWIFTVNFDNDDVVVYIYDAAKGTKLYDIMGD